MREIEFKTPSVAAFVERTNCVKNRFDNRELTPVERERAVLHEMDALLDATRLAIDTLREANAALAAQWEANALTTDELNKARRVLLGQIL